MRNKKTVRDILGLKPGAKGPLILVYDLLDKNPPKETAPTDIGCLQEVLETQVIRVLDQDDHSRMIEAALVAYPEHAGAFCHAFKNGLMGQQISKSQREARLAGLLRAAIFLTRNEQRVRHVQHSFWAALPETIYRLVFCDATASLMSKRFGEEIVANIGILFDERKDGSNLEREAQIGAILQAVKEQREEVEGGWQAVICEALIAAYLKLRLSKKTSTRIEVINGWIKKDPSQGGVSDLIQEYVIPPRSLVT